MASCFKLLHSTLMLSANIKKTKVFYIKMLISHVSWKIRSSGNIRPTNQISSKDEYQLPPSEKSHDFQLTIVPPTHTHTAHTHPTHPHTPHAHTHHTHTHCTHTHTTHTHTTHTHTPHTHLCMLHIYIQVICISSHFPRPSLFLYLICLAPADI